MHIIVDFFGLFFPPSFYIVEFLLLLLGMSNSLHPGGMQHTRLPWPSLSPSFLNSCPLSQWFHPTISSPVTLLFSCPQFSRQNLTWPKCNYSNWLHNKKDAGVENLRKDTFFGPWCPCLKSEEFLDILLSMSIVGWNLITKLQSKDFK